MAKNGRGQPIKRVGPVPCEASLGCPKGHWRDEIKLKPYQSAVIDLFFASRNHNVLTKSEKRHPIIRHLFASFEQQLANYERAQLVQVVTIATMKRETR